ncbi:MAG: glyoxylate reductase [Pirellulaceae bacterium]|jgi:glyoxylate reductase
MSLPKVIADGPLAEAVSVLLDGRVELLPWNIVTEESASPEGPSPVDGIYTYGHPLLDGAMLNRLSGVRVISNYGVGVDHINLSDAAERGIPVGNTPGILNGATADMAMTLLLAAGRRLIEGDAYARSPEFTTYDPGYMLGREIHGSTIGIIGMGRIGSQIAKRARGFDMRVLYHNRTRREADEAQYQATYCSLDDLLDQSDYVVVVTPLTAETKGLIDRPQFERMKSSAILVNIARGPIVSTDALTWALQEGQIYAAGLDVTDPEPLPRDHPLLSCKNLTIAPHLGSGTEQTRQRMAEVSVENLLAGLAGKPLVHQVG